MQETVAELREEVVRLLMALEEIQKQCPEGNNPHLNSIYEICCEELKKSEVENVE